MHRFRPAALALLIASSGCALFRTAELTPTSDTAVVRTLPWGKVYRSGFVQIVAIGAGTPRFGHDSEVAIRPGTQLGRFRIMLCTDSYHCQPIADSELELRAEAGHTYVVHAQERAHGSNTFWIWIEDAADGHTIAGRQPDSER